MKNIGYVLIIVGFLLGAYLSSLDARLVNWTYMAVALVIGFTGVVLVQLGNKRITKDEEVLASNISIIDHSIDNIVKKLDRLNAEKDNINTYDVGHKLDTLLVDDLNAFVEARQTIGHKYSLSAYADVMNHFAGGERYVNRVWSASADGYIDEVNKYLQKALDQFLAAKNKLQHLKSDSKNK